MKTKISPAQLSENKLQARRLMEHMDRVTPGGVPPMVGPFHGVASIIGRVWAILIVLLLSATIGFQISKATETPATEDSGPEVKTLEIPL